MLRLVGVVLVEIDDEWQVGRRYFNQASMRKLKEPDLKLPLGLPSPCDWPQSVEVVRPAELIYIHVEAPTKLHYLTRRDPQR